jgi:hypothetical protein
MPDNRDPPLSIVLYTAPLDIPSLVVSGVSMLLGLYTGEVLSHCGIAGSGRDRQLAHDAPICSLIY